MSTDYIHLQDYDEYCDMVDTARKMDVESSMEKQQWTTDEFMHVLRIHTDQVTHRICCFFVFLWKGKLSN